MMYWPVCACTMYTLGMLCWLQHPDPLLQWIACAFVYHRPLHELVGGQALHALHHGGVPSMWALVLCPHRPSFDSSR